MKSKISFTSVLNEKQVFTEPLTLVDLLDQYNDDPTLDYNLQLNQQNNYHVNGISITSQRNNEYKKANFDDWIQQQIQMKSYNENSEKRAMQPRISYKNQKSCRISKQNIQESSQSIGIKKFFSPKQSLIKQKPLKKSKQTSNILFSQLNRITSKKIQQLSNKQNKDHNNIFSQHIQNIPPIKIDKVNIVIDKKQRAIQPTTKIELTKNQITSYLNLKAQSNNSNNKFVSANKRQLQYSEDQDLDDACLDRYLNTDKQFKDQKINFTKNDQYRMEKISISGQKINIPEIYINMNEDNDKDQILLDEFNDSKDKNEYKYGNTIDINKYNQYSVQSDQIPKINVQLNSNYEEDDQGMKYYQNHITNEIHLEMKQIQQIHKEIQLIHQNSYQSNNQNKQHNNLPKLNQQIQEVKQSFHNHYQKQQQLYECENLSETQQQQVQGLNQRTSKKKIQQVRGVDEIRSQNDLSQVRRFNQSTSKDKLYQVQELDQLQQVNKSTINNELQQMHGLDEQQQARRLNKSTRENKLQQMQELNKSTSNNEQSMTKSQNFESLQYNEIHYQVQKIQQTIKLYIEKQEIETILFKKIKNSSQLKQDSTDLQLEEQTNKQIQPILIQQELKEEKKQQNMKNSIAMQNNTQLLQALQFSQLQKSRQEVFYSIQQQSQQQQQIINIVNTEQQAQIQQIEYQRKQSQFVSLSNDGYQAIKEDYNTNFSIKQVQSMNDQQNHIKQIGQNGYKALVNVQIIQNYNRRSQINNNESNIQDKQSRQQQQSLFKLDQQQSSELHPIFEALKTIKIIPIEKTAPSYPESDSSKKQLIQPPKMQQHDDLKESMEDDFHFDLDIDI